MIFNQCPTLGTSAPLALVPFSSPNGAETSSWQPLDPTWQSYYRSREPRMNVSSYLRGTMVTLRPHQWICLFLTFFLLYNPFFAAPRSGDGLEVCRPDSHRATIGASELQHFSPADGWGCLPAVSSTEAEVVLTLPDLSALSFLVSPSLPHFSRQFFGPGLWFRPPPAS
jgi:hypothetical protein